MIELFVSFVVGLLAGFLARPYYERWRAERQMVRARQESREKRSASAKAAAGRKANAMADGIGSPGGLNGFGQQRSGDQS